MIVVMGHLTVAAQSRAAYLETCEEVARQARTAAGCLDFAISADLLDPTRVNIAERWEDRESLEAFRAGGPSQAQLDVIEAADVIELRAQER